MKTSKLSGSIVEIEGELPVAAVEKRRAAAIKMLGKNLNVPGFRAGHLPENIIVKTVGEMAVYEEAAEAALRDEVAAVLVNSGVNPITVPEISILKITPGAPVAFKIKTNVMPVIILPDYKKIALEKSKEPEEKIEVSDEEVNKVLDEVRNARKAKAKNAENAGDAKTETAQDETPAPELDDNFVKQLGDFKDVADFKNKIKSNLELDKTHKVKQQKRATIAAELLKGESFDAPEVLVENELIRLTERIKGDVQSMGMKFEDYLKEVKKTEEDIRKDLRPDAVQNAKLQLILNKIALEEKISPDEHLVEHEARHLMEHYPGADLERAKDYVANLMRNEEVFKMLEGNPTSTTSI